MREGGGRGAERGGWTPAEETGLGGKLSAFEEVKGSREAGNTDPGSLAW